MGGAHLCDPEKALSWGLAAFAHVAKRRESLRRIPGLSHAPRHAGPWRQLPTTDRTRQRPPTETSPPPLFCRVGGLPRSCSMIPQRKGSPPAWPCLLVKCKWAVTERSYNKIFVLISEHPEVCAIVCEKLDPDPLNCVVICQKYRGSLPILPLALLHPTLG